MSDLYATARQMIADVKDKKVSARELLNAHLARNPRFAGIPMTVKDGYDVENMPAPSGTPLHRNRNKVSADADLVKRVRRASAVVWGKTYVPFMLADLQTPQGLPVGVQNIGPWHSEDRFFDYAAALEGALGGFVRPQI